MKRTISLALMVLLALTMLGSASAQERTVVTMAGINKESNYTGMIEVIEKLVPEAKVEYQFIDNSNYTNIIYTQLAAGMGPDIIVIDKPMIMAGFIEDISDMAFIKEFEPSSFGYFTVDGKIYGLPLTNWFEGMFYNKKIFADNGLSVPNTWEEYVQIHRTLSEAGIKPQTMGAQSWEPLMKSSFGFLLCEYYSKNPDYDAKFSSGEALSSQDWLEPLKTWKQLMDEGFLTSDMLGLTYDQSLDEFATGKAAMWESGPWAIDSIRAKNPDLEFGMFPFVGTEESSGKWLVGGVGEGFGINVNAQNKELARKVLEAMASDEALIAKCKDTAGSTTFKLGLEIDLPDEYADCAEAFTNGHIYCPWSFWGDVDAQALIVEMGNQYQAVLGGVTTLPDALKAFDDKMADLRSMIG